jgi:hypothetical protein
MQNKITIYILLFIHCFFAFGQNERYSINKIQQLYQNDSISFLYNQHTAVQPFFYGDVAKNNKSAVNLSITPLLFLEPTFSLNTEKQFTNNWGIGVQANLQTQKGWRAQINYLRHFFNYTGYYARHIEKTNEAYGLGYADTLTGATSYINGYIAYQPNKIFTFEAGLGNQFIGEGYRSLLLADNAYSYPYFKISTKFWKIKYENIYANWWDIRFSNGKYANFIDKYTTTHYLSYNPVKWLNVGFFETILFSAYDGDFYRGFDLNYINPVIFYRPVEYSQGSADNALMGLTIKAILKQKHVFYTQFLIDEFLLQEIRQARGWWANKFAVQAGVKSRDLFGIKHLNTLLEINVIRPFTYSYYDRNPGTAALLNYAHYGMSMAHPGGANLIEQLARVSYKKDKWLVVLKANYLIAGIDTGYTNYGQDIFKSYNSRTLEYGNKLLQGEKVTTLHSELKINYLLFENANILAFASIHNYQQKSSKEQTNQTYFTIGVKTFLRNRYDDY